MKKIYIKPNTETVNVRLIGSVMEGGQGYGILSHVAGGGDDPGFGGAKENNLDFDFDEDYGNIWDDGDNSSNPYDMWGE